MKNRWGNKETVTDDKKNAVLAIPEKNWHTETKLGLWARSNSIRNIR
jgi:hypothetical protein